MLEKLKPISDTASEAYKRANAFAMNVLSNVKQRIVRSAEAFKLPNFFNWAAQYTPSQWCYFISAIFLGITLFTEHDLVLVAAILAFIGLLRELINIFHKIWDTSIGKGFVILIYASTANLALAFAAIKINIITGIEPAPFIFTLGFTTLVLMPFWIALSSVLVFLIVLVLANIWLLASLLLRIIGFNVKVHWEDRKRAFLTMVLRIVLIPVVLVHLVTIMLPYAGGNLSNDSLGFKVNNDAAWINLNPSADQDEQSNDNLERLENQLGGGKESSAELQTAPKEQQDMVDKVQQKQLLIESMIAHFIFYLESYSQSACLKSEDQHSVIIDENMVLLISKNEDAVHGYDYEVAQCKPRYERPESEALEEKLN